MFSIDVLHRDIKPANILIHYPTIDEVSGAFVPESLEEFLSLKPIIKLADFGLAKLLTDDGGFAQTTLGTKFYWGPELWNAEKYNEASEIWALGSVMY